MAVVSEKVSGSISSSPPALRIPALLIMISSPPNSRTVFITRFLTETGSETSVFTKRSLPEDLTEPTSEANLFPSSSSRSAITTFTFLLKSASVIPAPNPLAPPVTMATLWVSLLPVAPG